MRLFFVLLAAVALMGATSLQASDRPNILIVLADDLNNVLGATGDPSCKTPHLDEFAGAAVSFTRAYCQFPLCGPSRASLMSGQYPWTNGVTNNGGHIAKNRVTLPLHFQNHGYSSTRVSKIYHMGIPGDILTGTAGGDHPPSWQETHNIAALETMTPGDGIDFTAPHAFDNFPSERQRWSDARESNTPYEMTIEARGQYAVVEVADKDAGLLPDTMAADKAIELLDSHSATDSPFFLAVGFVRPHFPFVTTKTSLAHYHAQEIAYPTFPKNDYDDIPPQAINGRLELPDDDVRALRRGYFGAVTFMDEQFGRLIAKIDQLKLRDNTIIVFASDHGYLLGEHQMWKKTKLWEEAIHVPLMIAAPGIKGGNTCDRPVELIDIYPTLTELAGLSPEPQVQGLSLVSLLKNPSSERSSKPDALSQIPRGHCLRTERWAYMWYPQHKNDPEASMLFDMDKDPNQFTNLATHPEYETKKSELHTRLLERISTASPAE